MKQEKKKYEYMTFDLLKARWEGDAAKEKLSKIKKVLDE